MKALVDPSAESIRELLRHIAPELGDGLLDISVWETVARYEPRWARGHAVVDGSFIVKFAWSDAAAAALARQIRVMELLRPTAVAAPHLLAVCDAPVAALYRRVTGEPISWDWLRALASTEVDAIARSMAAVLSDMHSDATRTALSVRDLALPPPRPQATSERLRTDFLPLIDAERAARVRSLLDRVDVVLERRAAGPVVLHGDFHGHNLVRNGLDIVAVLDFEETAIGDHHYDFRYLPALEPTLGLLHAVVAAYQEVTTRAVDIERILAWHSLTDLGDGLWRTEARVEVVGGPLEAKVDKLFARFAEAEIVL